MVQALGDADRWDQAINLASDSAAQLSPYLETRPDDWRGMVGALKAEVAYVYARRGQHGQAWAHWKRASEVAQGLRAGYRHVQSSFSQAVLGAHATTLGVERRRSGEALRAADGFDPDAIPSLARRSRHFIEVARGHHQLKERAAVWALLNCSERTASETIRYNGVAREMLLDLRRRPPTGMREDVQELCTRVGLAN